MQEVNSRDLINRKKHEFYESILPGILAKQSKIKKSILSDTNNVVVMPNEFGVKFGPVFGNFDPSISYGKPYKEIVENLALSINPYKVTFDKPNVKVRDLQDLSLAQNKVELDVYFEKKVNYDFNPDSIMQPIGFKAKIKEIDYLSNPKIPWQVDQILQDKLKAVQSIHTLKDYGFDNYYLTKIFSAGNLGLDKKLVTTRQSITAVDDTLGKQLLQNIREFDNLDSYLVFENEYLHNRFVIILAQGNIEYEQFELWPKDSEWGKYGFNHEFEGFYGRKDYAESQAGGYYAARLGVLEYLFERKKQARVLVIREIYDDYSIPVGVWQVRESVRTAMKKPAKIFSDKKEVLQYIKGHLKYDTGKYLHQSNLFKQSRIVDFFK